ncbi:hypothetical protein D6764_03175 [Candidatus Woesearchaeota archaeon]|nr:MAG: hypothetical protein D6764_03175 [Candidatus Woesearchaeota archaeon]
MVSRVGKVHVYTGESKGKTTTAFGMALRAYGQNMKVCIIQFMKGGAYTGEFITIKNYLPGLEIYQYGKPCIKERTQLRLDQFSPGEEHKVFREINYLREDINCGACRYCFLDDAEQQEMVRKAWEHAQRAVLSGNYDMVILDEINVALQKGFIKTSDVLELMRNRPPKLELILTGRGAPKEIIDAADLVTEFRMVKHYFNDGTPARRGIEY